MDEYSKYAATFSHIAALQLPTLISVAPKGSTLERFQSIGFPFNMSKAFLRDHLSFSPANMAAGRYYTLVTSLFNHADPHHLFTNLIVLATSGIPVHRKIGRWHFTANFLGGGIAGNLAMWLQYHIQRKKLQNGLMDAKLWPLFKDTRIGNSLDQAKQMIVGSSFDSLNSLISCIGCSASISAVVSLEACIAMETSITKLRQFIQSISRHQPGDAVEVDLSLIYDIVQLSLACAMLWSDLQAMIGDSSSRTSFFDNIFAYTLDRIGHSGHLGGFLFGIVYYFVCRR